MDNRPERILANLKMRIENFLPEDIDDGFWAYYEVAKALGQTVMHSPKFYQ